MDSEMLSPASRELILKLECKKWEKSFEKINGRKPGRPDIKASGDDVQQMYREYWAIIRGNHQLMSQQHLKKKGMKSKGDAPQKTSSMKSKHDLSPGQENSCLSSHIIKTTPVKLPPVDESKVTGIPEKVCKTLFGTNGCGVWSENLLKKNSHQNGHPENGKRDVGPACKPFIKSLMKHYKDQRHMTIEIIRRRSLMFKHRIASTSHGFKSSDTLPSDDVMITGGVDNISIGTESNENIARRDNSIKINQKTLKFLKHNNLFGDYNKEQEDINTSHDDMMMRHEPENNENNISSNMSGENNKSQKDLDSDPKKRAETIFGSILHSMITTDETSNHSIRTTGGSSVASANSLFDDDEDSEDDEVLKEVKKKVKDFVEVEGCELLPLDWKQKKKKTGNKKKVKENVTKSGESSTGEPKKKRVKKPKDNFVRINMKRKCYASKGYKKFDVQKYKRRQNRALKRNRCFNCGEAGHWADSCPAKNNNDADGIPILDADAVVSVVYDFDANESHGRQEATQQNMDQNYEIRLFDEDEMRAEFSSHV